uniref:GDNF-inducible zinc finger protein 1 n=2 Tax=Zeugodacus cucurbitae TaxID=28588 RepID=A0A0A1WI98_ZEUCU
MQCRVCMKTKCNILFNMSIADTVEGQTLFDCFNYCTQLHATASDNFPQTLCQTCTRKLRIAYSFRKCALQSHVMFEKLLIVQKSKKQTTVNSIMDSAVYADDPLSIEFNEALKFVKESDREQLQLVENGGNELSNLEIEYVYDSPLISEPLEVEVEQPQTSCYNDNIQSQAHIIEEAYEESALAGVEECETDTVEYIVENLEKHKKLRDYKFNLLNKHDKHSNTSLSPYKKCVKQKPENENEKNTSTSDCDMPHDDQEVHGTISYMEEPNHYKISENASDETSVSINMYTQCDRYTALSTEENPQEKLDNHKLEEKGKYLCSFCPRVLSSKRAVEIHEGKQHLNIEPDLKECTFCQKKFNKVYLRKHIENVHIGERKYKCDICGNMYKTNDNVMRHRQLHTKDRNYPCAVCDKRFTEKSELKVHMRLHTGEKPFACHLCERRFRIRVHLTYHLQQHARIKHKCDVCGKEFKHVKSLRNHLYLHTDVMPYRCAVCGYGSVKRDYFVKHMLHKHDKTMSVDELFVIFQANTGRSPYVKVVDNIDMNDEHTQDMATSN